MRTVLVLDDETCVLDVLAMFLKRNGYLVRQCSSRDSAFEQFQLASGAIDLVIADVTMPVISGVEVGLQLKACTPGLRLLFISGYPVEFWKNDDAERVRGLPSDSIRILQKPFSPTVLISKVNELIGPA